MFSSTPMEAYSQLLATEDLTLRYSSKASTAWFNLNDRVITLPTLGFLGQVEQQMMTAHEVGHALHTPWNDQYMEQADHYGVLLNIVEDIRIERLLKQTYPGLASIFQDAYKTLWDENFFRTTVDEIPSLAFIDKLNLHFKVGHCINIPFTQEEAAIVSKCYKLKTIEDVYSLCEEIQGYAEKEGRDQPEEDDMSGFGESENGDEEQFQPSIGNNNREEKEEDSDDASEESSDEGEPEDGSSNEGPDSSEEITETKAAPKAGSTYENFQDAMEEAQAAHRQEEERWYAHDLWFTTSANENRWVDYSGHLANFWNFAKEEARISHNGWHEHTMDAIESRIDILKRLAREGNQQFLMLRNAKRIREAKYRQTGSIDMRRLAKYRTSESIFKTRKLKDRQTNHGVVMLIDYSGSMHDVLGSVLDQTIITCEFCRANNIKFEVYLFGGSLIHQRYLGGEPVKVFKLCDERTYKAEHIMVLSREFVSEMLHEFRVPDALDDEWRKTIYPWQLGMYNTPTPDGLLAAHQALRKMRLHGCEKTHLIFLSDGDANEWNFIGQYTVRGHHAFRYMADRDEGDIADLDPRVCFRENATVTVDGVKYDTGKIAARSIDAVTWALFDRIAALGTEITYSFINCYRSHWDISFGTSSFVNTVLKEGELKDKVDVSKEIQTFPGRSEFGIQNVILMNVPRTAPKERPIKHMNTKNVQKILARQHSRNAYLGVFITELAKKIA